MATLKGEKLRQIAQCDGFSSFVSTEFGSHPALSDLSTPSNPFSQDLRWIAFEELKKATGNFRRNLCLGEGTFGVIHKGWIRESTLTAATRFIKSFTQSGIPVAVKKWRSHTKLDLVAWLAEFRYLRQLDHQNVVKLIGYCCDRDNLVLVYEYMPKGSLNNQLFTRRHQPLSWDARIKVAIGAARGLSFLHDRKNPIIHGDVHVDHILLDEEFNAKLSGFGLARDGPVNDMSRDSTRVVGTSGFLPPEYVMTGRVTTKCDVFAFGVVLLEILSGRRALNLIMAVDEEDGPVDWVNIYMKDEAKLTGLIDTKLKGRYPHNGAVAAVRLGFQCLNSNPELRPPMAAVSVALQHL